MFGGVFSGVFSGVGAIRPLVACVRCLAGLPTMGHGRAPRQTLQVPVPVLQTEQERPRSIKYISKTGKQRHETKTPATVNSRMMFKP